MRTPRVSVPGAVRTGDLIEIPAEEGLHLAGVLRRAPGDPVILVAESGGLFPGLIASIDGTGRATRVMVAVVGGAAKDAPPLLAWVAAVALARGDAFDLAVRMAAELGMEAILPLLTERAVVRVPGRGRIGGARGGLGGATAKEERWRRIAREAAKQCGREAPLEILRPRPLPEVLEAWSRDPSLPADFPGGPPRRARVAVPGGPFRLEDFLGTGGDGPAPAIFVIGPEGGLSPGEIARASAAGFEAVGFPTPVLRTPTAVALLGALGVLAAAGARRKGPLFRVDSPAGPP